MKHKRKQSKSNRRFAYPKKQQDDGFIRYTDNFASNASSSVKKLFSYGKFSNDDHASKNSAKLNKERSETSAPFLSIATLCVGDLDIVEERCETEVKSSSDFCDRNEISNDGFCVPKESSNDERVLEIKGSEVDIDVDIFEIEAQISQEQNSARVTKQKLKAGSATKVKKGGVNVDAFISEVQPEAQISQEQNSAKGTKKKLKAGSATKVKKSGASVDAFISEVQPEAQMSQEKNSEKGAKKKLKDGSATEVMKGGVNGDPFISEVQPSQQKSSEISAEKKVQAGCFGCTAADVLDRVLDDTTNDITTMESVNNGDRELTVDENLHDLLMLVGGCLGKCLPEPGERTKYVGESILQLAVDISEAKFL